MRWYFRFSFFKFLFRSPDGILPPDMEEPILLEQEKEEQRRYRLTAWWVEHRAFLFKLLLVAFAALDAALILFALWTFAESFLVRAEAERVAVADMAVRGQDDLRAFTAGTAAAPLSPSRVTALPSVDGKADLYATVENPNADWRATFAYRFRAGTVETPSQKGFVLPGSEKPLIAFAVGAASALSGAELVIEDLRWHRVDKRLTGDYEEFAADRLAISVTDAAFTVEPSADGKPSARVTFSVTNGSAYGYYDPSFVVLLKRGAAVVGVTRTTLSRLEAGETQQVAINWSGPIPSVSQAVVVPDIDIFDEAAYLPVGE